MRVLWILSVATVVVAYQRTDNRSGQVERIAHGVKYDHERYPYVVALIFREYSFQYVSLSFRLVLMETKCTGTLISPLIVLTAAHCTDEKAAYMCKVYPGSLRDRHHNVGVRKIHQHPAFNKGTLKADLSLLKIQKPFQNINRFAVIAGLPADFAYGNAQDCMAIGFGRTATGINSDDGLIINVIIKYGVNACGHRNADWDFPGNSIPTMRPEFLCSVPDIHTVCPGDSGGPLICGEHQYGVTSNGAPYSNILINDHCGSDQIIDFYVFLHNYKDWIHSSMQALDDGRSETLEHQFFFTVIVAFIMLCVQY